MFPRLRTKPLRRRSIVQINYFRLFLFCIRKILWWADELTISVTPPKYCSKGNNFLWVSPSRFGQAVRGARRSSEEHTDTDAFFAGYP